MARTFNLAEWSKIRPLRHLPKGFALPDGSKVTQPNGTKLTSGDLTNEDGTVNAEACAFFQIEPTEVRPITRSDLGSVYEGTDGTKMLAEYARSCGKSENDMLCELVVSSAGEDAYFAIVRKLQPKTEKAVSRAWETIMESFPGLTRAQVEEKLASLRG